MDKSQKTCLQCGTKFNLKGTIPHQKGFCSKKCYDEARKNYVQQEKMHMIEAGKPITRKMNRVRLRKYYRKNRDKVNEYRRKYYQKNKEKLNKKRREYYQKNKEKLRPKQAEHQRLYRQKNKERLRQYWKEYYQKRKQYYRERYQKRKIAVSM